MEASTAAASPSADAAGSESSGAPPKEPTAPQSEQPAVSGQPGGDQAVPTAGGITGGQSVRLSFVGDVIFAGNVEELLKRNGWDYPYRYVHDYIHKADISVANLETPISKRGTPQSKEYVYRSSPDALRSFKAAGFDVVTTANNHILDYGQEALLDTLDELDKAGIKRVGTGRNSDEAYRPAIVEHNGIKVAFVGFSRVAPAVSWYAGKQTPGVAETYSTKLALEAVSQARQQADLVVVLAHWGVERTDRPVKEQTDLAHKYINQGADLVIGSHPHVLQGFEQYKGKWIAYSMGNFIFTTNNEPSTWETMILDAVCTRERVCELQMMPVLTKGAQPVRMTEEDGAKLLDRMSRISINAKLEPDGRVRALANAPAPTSADEASSTVVKMPTTRAAGPVNQAAAKPAATTKQETAEQPKPQQGTPTATKPAAAQQMPKQSTPTAKQPAAEQQTPQSTPTAKQPAAEQQTRQRSTPAATKPAAEHQTPKQSAPTATKPAAEQQTPKQSTPTAKQPASA
ncbi:CapA family protein [Paenibacillus xerothermodurans]|uniref:CapA family protein n=1 Tax=Paenibacillus xerothermodurans TaxID=1977292 RepID=A0A2W1P208_PAEXE|nr:CapA family protein [Paenibacillus xerothermodurans]